MKSQRLVEMARELVSPGEQPTAACCACQRPWLALFLGTRYEAVRRGGGRGRIAQAQVDVDELWLRRQVDVANVLLAQRVRLRDVVVERERGPAEPELEITERLNRPDVVGAHAELRAQAPGFGGMHPAALLAALARFEPREPRQRCGQL